MCENERANEEEDLCENQQLCEEADVLVVEEVSVDRSIKTYEGSMLVNASQLEGTACEPRELEVVVLPVINGESETEQVAPCLENDGFDPELNEQLKLAAVEMMRELHEECERKERARAGNVKVPVIGDNRDRKVESEQAKDNGVTGTRVDNRYY